MNLDELGKSIRSLSADPVVHGIADQLSAWKDSPATAEQLATTIERYIGNTWIASACDHQKAYDLWSAFRNESIGGIRAMTMNERLYAFSLFERFDSCQSDADRLALYAKLHASVA